MFSRTRPIRAAWSLSGVFLLALLAVLPTLAAPPNSAAQHFRGRITAVQVTAPGTGSITIQPAGGPAKTLTVTPATSVTLDRQPSTFDKVNTSQEATVSTTDGTSAVRIEARTPHAAPAPPPTPPAPPHHEPTG